MSTSHPSNAPAERAQSTSKHAALLFDALLAATRQAVVIVDDETQISILNDAARTVLDLPPGEHGCERVELHLDALRERASVSGDEQTADGALWMFEGPRGHSLRVTVSSVPGLATAQLWILDDITRENAAELEALHHETRFHSALDGMLDGFFLLRAARDANGAIIDFTFAEMNSEGAALIQSKRETLMGLSVRRMLPFMEQSGLFDLCRRVHDSGIRYEGEYHSLDGRIAAEWLRLYVIPSGDGVAITFRDITEKKQVEDALREQSLYDELTGLLNRRGFRKIVEHELLVARRTDRHDALLLVDIDDFKSINENFGRAAADEALRSVAETLRDTTRQSDLVARRSDDEFLVFAVDGHGSLLANRIVDAVEAENERSSSTRGFRISVSIGVADIASGEEFDGIAARADSELYTAKQSRSPSVRSVA